MSHRVVDFGGDNGHNRRMKMMWFHLMPYPKLPDDFNQKHRSVWVDIDPALFDTRRDGGDVRRPTSTNWSTPRSAVSTASASTSITTTVTA